MYSFNICARLLALGSAASLLSASAFAEDITNNLQFNGYATAGAAWTNNAKGAKYLYNALDDNSKSITADPSMDYDSVIGLQFNYRINDSTNLMTQLAASAANDNFAVKAHWAYIAYQVNDELTVRAGRFAFPTFLYSENLHVGEAYPWARLPSEIYSSLDGFENINGLEALYLHDFGNWNLTVQPTFGNAAPPSVQAKNVAGITFNLSNDKLIFQLGAITDTNDISFTKSPSGQALLAQTDNSLTANGMAASIPTVNAQIASSLDIKDDRATYFDAGFVYDDGHWFGAAEYAQFRIKNWPQDYNAGYVSVGHYFGRFLPYALLSRIDSVHDQKSLDNVANLGNAGATLAQVNRKDQNTLALGVRYQLRRNVSLKAQVDRISNFRGTSGLFTPDPAQTTPLNTVYLYSLSLNTAF